MNPVNSVDIQFPSIRDVYETKRTEMVEPGAQEVSFAETLQEKIAALSTSMQETEGVIQDFMVGEREIHDVLMAVQKTNIEFRLAVQVRNKLIDAYQEIMRMQI